MRAEKKNRKRAVKSGIAMATGMALTSLFTRNAVAATTTYTWDPGNSTTGPTDGGGNWDTTTADWYISGTGDGNKWVSSGGGSFSDASIGGGTVGSTAQTITLNGNLSASTVFFTNAATQQPYTLAGNGTSTLTITGAVNFVGNTIISAPISASSFTINGAGTGALVLSGANTITGCVTLYPANVQLGSSGALGNATEIYWGTGVSTLDLNGYSPSATTQYAVGGGLGTQNFYNTSSTSATVTGNMALLTSINLAQAAGGTLTVGSQFFDALSGGLTTHSIYVGSSALTGTVLLTGNNSADYNGTFRVTNGTLQMGNGTSGYATGAAGFSISLGATLAFDQATASTISAPITDLGAVVGLEGSSHVNTLSGGISSTGGFTQSGAGTTVLSTANSYTGATTILGGTLQVNGSTASGSAVTVGGASASGTPTLTGNGTIGGAVTVYGTASAAAGTVNPGAGGVGSLTTGALTYSAGANFDFAPSGSSVNELVVGGSTTGSGGNVVITPTSLSSGNYQLATDTSGTGLSANNFTLAGAPSNYRLVNGNATALDLQEYANQTLTAAAPSVINIITGCTTTVSGTLTNTALSGATALNVSLSNNGSTGGTLSGFSPSAGSTVAVGAPSVVGATLTAGAVGTGLSWSLKNVDGNATTTTATLGGTVNVYNHSQASFTSPSGTNSSVPAAIYGNDTISLGTLTFGAAASTLSLANLIANFGASSALLDFTTLTAGGSNTSAINFVPVYFSSLTGSSVSSASAGAATLTAGSLGNFTNTYTLELNDDSSVIGNNTTDSELLTLTLTGSVKSFAAFSLTNGSLSGSGYSTAFSGTPTPPGHGTSSTITVSGSHGSYAPAYLNNISTLTQTSLTGDKNLVTITGIANNDGPEVIGLHVNITDSNPSGNLTQDLTDVINDLEASATAQGSNFIVEAFSALGSSYGNAGSVLMANDPTNATAPFNIAIVDTSGFNPGGSLTLGLNFTGEFGTDGTISSVQVTDIGVVPEPASLGMLMAAALPMIARPRKRRRSGHE